MQLTADLRLIVGDEVIKVTVQPSSQFWVTTMQRQ